MWPNTESLVKMPKDLAFVKFFFYHFLSNLGTIQMDDFIDTFNKKVESTI